MARKRKEQRQPQEFDNTLKALFGRQAKKIIPRLLPGAEVADEQNIEIDRTTLRADLAFRIHYRERLHIINIELQTDGIIERRLLQYHACLHAKYELPVISVVLYPFETTVARPPYVEEGGDGVLLTFDYTVICLWEMEARPLVDDRFVWLYSLLPTMKGANPTLLKQALQEMWRHHTPRQFGHHLQRFRAMLRRSNMLSPADRREMEEEIHMRYRKYDWFVANDPVVIKLVSDAEQEGERKGMQEGKQKGKLEGLRQSAILIVATRFAELEPLAQTRMKQFETVEHLNHLIASLLTASSEAEARQLLEQAQVEPQPEG